MDITNCHGWCRPTNDVAPHPSEIPLQPSRELECPSQARPRTNHTSCRGMPRLLKVMCLEHLDHPLIHRLQQSCGVVQQEDELDVLMQVLQHMGMGRIIIQGHQDTEGEALRRAVLPQLVHQGHPAVILENEARHFTSGIQEPIDRQACLCIALDCTKVLGLIHNDRPKLAVSRQARSQQEGETVLKCLEAGADFSLMMCMWSGNFFCCRPVSSMLNT